MKQITIYDLLPLLKKGWVAYDGNGWAWFSNKPKYELDKFVCIYRWMIHIGDGYNLSGKCCPFNIKPFDGSWEDSLIKVEAHKWKFLDDITDDDCRALAAAYE